MTLSINGNSPNISNQQSENEFDDKMEKLKQERRADQLKLAKENREINYVNGLKSNLELIR